MSPSSSTLRDLPRRPGMRASLVAGTAVFAMAQGISMEQITAATGLLPEDLRHTDEWLPERILPEIWQLIRAACPGRAVAIEMARIAPFSVFGPLAYTARHAQNLRTLLTDFVRYQMVMSDRLQLELVEDSQQARVTIFHPMDALDGGLAAEMGLALGARFGWEYMELGQHGLTRVELAHAPNGPVEAYEDYFKVPVIFERPVNTLYFRTDFLEQVPRQTDPALYRYIQEHLDEVRERILAESGSDPVAQIRAAVARNGEKAEYGAEALARSLGMSLRKLQRVTFDHGTTVRGIIEEVREAHARQLLGDRRLSVEEVAFLLGYSDDRAFRRAFKRWTGTTPAQLRRAMPKR